MSYIPTKEILEAMKKIETEKRKRRMTMLNAKGWVMLRLSITLLIQFILFMLKITGAVNWSWVIIMIPLWITIAWELVWTILILWQFRK